MIIGDGYKGENEEGRRVDLMRMMLRTTRKLVTVQRQTATTALKAHCLSTAERIEIQNSKIHSFITYTIENGKTFNPDLIHLQTKPSRTF